MALHGLTVGESAFIRAGVVLTRDVPPGAVMLGVPRETAARPADASPELARLPPNNKCKHA